MEDWRAVVGFSGLYEVSNAGRVRSVEHVSETANRWGRIKRRFPSRILVLTTSTSGYPQVTLCDGKGGRHQRHVHRLVADAFLGPRPEGSFVLHGDGNKARCDSENLRFGSVKDNSMDAAMHGSQVRGSRQGSAKLTEDQVREILRSKPGATNEAIAIRFGVSEATVAGIVRRDSWKHVSGDEMAMN